MSTVTTAVGDVRVETSHAGGNGVVRAVEGDELRLSPELRDSVRRPWYWNVELTAPAAADLTVSFDEPLVSPRGPAVLQPNGSWDWLGTDSRLDEDSFEVSLAAEEPVRLALAPAYQRADFEGFLTDAADDLTVDVLTTSEGGRPVPLVRWNGTATRHVVLACRHHARETTASYVFEGLLSGLLDEVFPEDVAVHAVPFVDVDGVERGDQGKHRAPHDHNRDYVDGNAICTGLDPIYRSTAAMMDYLRGLAASGDLVLGMDFHCPTTWRGDCDRPFFVADAEDHPDHLADLADDLAGTAADAPLSFDPTPGVGVHGFRGQSGLTHTFSRFTETLGADLGVAFETPLAGTDDDPVTPESSRQLGRHLATATGTWLAER